MTRPKDPRDYYNLHKSPLASIATIYGIKEKEVQRRFVEEKWDENPEPALIDQNNIINQCFAIGRGLLNQSIVHNELTGKKEITLKASEYQQIVHTLLALLNHQEGL